jgi:uncharacterized protein (DUF1499 family)
MTGAMARRYIAEDPMSRLAVWARRMAVFSLVAALLSIIIVRSGLLEIRPALATFAAALAFAVLALLLAFAAFIVIWKDGAGGMGRALAAIGMSLGLLAYPSYLAYKAYRLPWIYDITTDPIDPPRYDALARIRPRDANPVIYAGLATAAQQQAAYPEVAPLEEETTPQAAYRVVLAVVAKRHWRIVDERPPRPPRSEGHIEAVARTPIMGFREDVVIRIRPNEDGVRIDVRSASRYGELDFGSNAARIRQLVEAIDDAIGNLKPERPAVPPKQRPVPKRKANQASSRR